MPYKKRSHDKDLLYKIYCTLYKRSLSCILYKRSASYILYKRSTSYALYKRSVYCALYKESISCVFYKRSVSCVLYKRSVHVPCIRDQLPVLNTFLYNRSSYHNRCPLLSSLKLIHLTQLESTMKRFLWASYGEKDKYIYIQIIVPLHDIKYDANFSRKLSLSLAASGFSKQYWPTSFGAWPPANKGIPHAKRRLAHTLSQGSWDMGAL